MGILRPAVVVVTALALAGCAVPQRQGIEPKLLTTMQPVEVKLGVRQSELYAAFVPSTAGASGAAACGAVPGLGILLAAACGGAFGAIDAQVNATRAKAADESARPLKNVLIEFDFDRSMREAVERSLGGEPAVQATGLDLVKTVTDKVYEDAFRASKANAVMFMTADYQVVADFSAIRMTLRNSLFARSPVARVAAGQPETLPSGTGNASDAPLQLRNASYRSDIVYLAKLPKAGDSIEANVAAWQANDGRLLKAALQSGVRHLGRLLAEDLRRGTAPDAPQTASSAGAALTTAVPPGTPGVPVRSSATASAGTLLDRSDEGVLNRMPGGALQFDANLDVLAAAYDRGRLPQLPVAAAGEAATR